MRCTSCGLPLSPARTMTSCPRCGTPIVSEKKPSSSPKQQPFLQAEAWQPLAEQPQLPETVRSPMKAQQVGKNEDNSFQPVSGPMHAPITHPPASPTALASIHVQSAPELDPMWLPAPTPASSNPGSNSSSVQSAQAQGYGIGSGMRTDEQLNGFPQGAPASLHQARSSAAVQRRPWQPTPMKATMAGRSEVGMIHRPLRRRNSNLGFLMAGLCVITGGLMLFFIYFMALGSPDNSNSNSAAKTRIAINASPIRTPSSAPSSTATPFPGQKYIDHAQLSSRIDPASHEATELTTTFKVNQTMYITFQLHPAGQSGAVCLFWYANNKQFLTYQLQVYPNEQSSYSYATYKGTGSGYVELYWASTTTCTDKILAQHVNFTVTA